MASSWEIINAHPHRKRTPTPSQFARAPHPSACKPSYIWGVPLFDRLYFYVLAHIFDCYGGLIWFGSKPGAQSDAHILEGNSKAY